MPNQEPAPPEHNRGASIVLHPLAVRLAHWTFALATVLLIGSGWRIHNFSGFLGFVEVPVWMTIGGSFEGAQAVHGEIGLAGALLWHFAAMWLLFASLAFYVVWGVVSGHFRRRFLPIRRAAVQQDVGDFLRGRLAHDIGARNAVQKLLYTLAVVGLAVLVWSGMVLWKPIQFQWLAWPLGGYVGARYIHIAAMAGMVLFTFVHVLLVVLVPKTLPPMITGRADAGAVPPELLQGEFR